MNSFRDPFNSWSMVKGLDPAKIKTGCRPLYTLCIAPPRFCVPHFQSAFPPAGETNLDMNHDTLRFSSNLQSAQSPLDDIHEHIPSQYEVQPAQLAQSTLRAFFCRSSLPPPTTPE